jgi:uncharacterized protein
MANSQMAVAAAQREGFVPEKVLTTARFDEITEVRIYHPKVIEGEARRRKKRAQLTLDGKLALVAADHPGRGVTKIRDDQLALGDRYQLIARVRRLLDDPNLDGILATSDLLEELLILSHLERKQKSEGFLDGRVLVGSMNRGGLSGTAFEMDDTFTGMTAERLAELRCDGGKMLYRLDPEDPASGRTVEACADAINSLRRHRLAAFVEALEVKRGTDGYHTVQDNAALIRQCGIAAALGDSSAHVWLKLPYSEDFGRVCRATTLPILLLGGPARESPIETLRDFAAGLTSSPRVRGAIIGRNLLFPPDRDPLPMCRALTAMIHRGAGFNEAVQLLAETPAAVNHRSNAKPNRRQRLPA